jgi:hypothetical protein
MTRLQRTLGSVLLELTVVADRLTEGEIVIRRQQVTVDAVKVRIRDITLPFVAARIISAVSDARAIFVPATGGVSGNRAPVHFSARLLRAFADRNASRAM